MAGILPDIGVKLLFSLKNVFFNSIFLEEKIFVLAPKCMLLFPKISIAAVIISDFFESASDRFRDS